MGPRRSPNMSSAGPHCALRGFKTAVDFDDPVAKEAQAFIISIKSKFGVDYRRNSLRLEPSEHTYERFIAIVKELHSVTPECAEDEREEFVLSYTSVDGDTLPISNDDNLRVCLHVRPALLRLTLQRRCESHEEQLGYGNPTGQQKKNRLTISQPQDFRRVSSIVDADILPHQYRRVKLCKYYTNKPLGFFIKEGFAQRITPWGIIATTGVFISRLLENGLAASTNLLSKGDEILEVNSIDITGKTIDQVTDMMHANAKNLILTVKPSIQTHPTLRIPSVYLAPPSYAPGTYFDPPPPSAEMAYPYRIRKFDQSLCDVNRRMAKSILIEDPVYRPPGYRHYEDARRNSSQYSSGERTSSSNSASGRFTPKFVLPDAIFSSRNSTLRVSDKAADTSARSFRNGNHQRPYSVNFDSVDRSRSAKAPSNITVF